MKQDVYGKNELIEFLDRKVFPVLDRATVFKDLEPNDKGFYYNVRCPRCNFRDASVYKSGYVLKCYRINKCGHTVSLVGYVNKGSTPKTSEEFLETVKRLAQAAGVSMPRKPFREDVVERARRRESRHAILESVIADGQRRLWSPQGEAMRNYLRDARGFSDDEIQDFQLGLFGKVAEVRQSLQEDAHASEDIDNVGLLDKSFEDHIIVPWADEHGRPVTFYARWPGESPPKGTTKSTGLATPDAARAFPLCFNLSLRHRHKDLVLVQGVFDAFILQARGDTRVVASGEEELSRPQVETLKRHKVRSVTLCFESGRGGDTALFESLNRLSDAGIMTYVAPSLPNHLDPERLVVESGIGAWKQHLSRSVSSSVYCGLRMMGDVSPESGEIQRRQAIEKVLDYTGSLRGEWAILEREDLLRSAAERTGYAYEHLVDLATQHGVRRHVDKVLRDALLKLSRPEIDVLKLAHKVSVDLSAVQVRQEAPLALSVERLDRESAEGPTGSRSGWRALDTLDIRFKPGELSLVAARPGHGKTAFLIGLLANWMRMSDDAGRDDSFIFYTAAEPEVRIYHRLLSILSVEAGDGWSVGEIASYLRDPSVRELKSEWPDPKSLSAAKERLRSWEGRIQIVYRPAWTVDEIAAYARMLKEKGPIGGIFVDFLQRIAPSSNAGGQEKEMVAISRRLKSLSSEVYAPVVAGTEIAYDTVPADVRTKVGRTERFKDSINIIRGARPVLANLREDGSDQEADFVLGLLNYAADYRVGAEKSHDVPDTTLFEVGALKNPFGAAGSWASLYLIGKYLLIRDNADDAG
ncbi:Replicative DNA helicase [Planctomycetes bacterium Pan216]|uniref:Replicative DNA helicase n=1 Tax=Kolteria novifilia TaxID=2527975 RepID=A0A518B7E3_9BACT|nr:Replicative DNA helicase [Planctomycetes bacterium Pan216]